MTANKKSAPPVNERVVERTRRAILWGFSSFLALLFGAGILYALGVFDGAAQPGEDYTRIGNEPAPAAGDTISIVEYFFYGCPHCRDFDPQVEDFRNDLPAGTTFKRTPVVFGDMQQELQARTYLVLEAAEALDDNHSRIFKALHEDGRRLETPQAMAEFVDGHGIVAPAFLRMLNSGAVSARLRTAQRAQQRSGISSVPSLVVGDTYLIEVGKVGRAQALKIARQLAEQMHKGIDPGLAPGAGSARPAEPAVNP